MGRLSAGAALLVLATLMLLGFLRSDLSMAEAAVLVALMLTVLAPAAGGVALIRSARGAARRDDRLQQARRQRALEAEVLRLAAERGDRITVIELVRDLSLSAQTAKDTLDAMMRSGLAEIEVTDSGGLVYTFPELKRLADRDRSRGVLDE